MSSSVGSTRKERRKEVAGTRVGEKRPMKEATGDMGEPKTWDTGKREITDCANARSQRGGEVRNRAVTETEGTDDRGGRR